MFTFLYKQKVDLFLMNQQFHKCLNIQNLKMEQQDCICINKVMILFFKNNNQKNQGVKLTAVVLSSILRKIKILVENLKIIKNQTKLAAAFDHYLVIIYRLCLCKLIIQINKIYIIDALGKRLMLLKLYSIFILDIFMLDIKALIQLIYCQIIKLSQMSIRQMLMSKCQLCSGQNVQMKMIFKQLYIKFKNLLSSQQLDFSMAMENGNEMEGFVQLLRVLNMNKSEKNKKKNQCKHPRFLKMMQKSLNCNFNTLNYLFEITANKIAEKNYGLSLIESQFKNIGERVVHDNHHLPTPSISQVKIEEPQMISTTSIQIERQVQAGNGKCVEQLGVTQTTIDQIGVDFISNGYNFYYQFPFFYGKQE